MSPLRPEALARLRRWREVALALGLAVLGLWTAALGGLFYQTLGALVGFTGAGLALSAWRRLRFRREPTAPGIVEIDEGRIAYFGPETGGLAALSELVSVEVMEQDGQRMFRLRQTGAAPLLIPVSAAGAERLYDIFATLPGASAEVFVAALDQPLPQARLLWARAGTHRGRVLPRA
jgi:hypothetical protein